MLGLSAMKRASHEILLVLVLFFASSGTVQQYLGLAGVALYLLGLAVAVPLALRVLLPWFEAHTDQKRAAVLAAATFVLLVVAFAIVYPHVNVHTAGAGSDRDDAANIGTRHLFHLQYPYATPTYLGNMISQLPGAFILDAPFVALGSSAYQNVVWLIVLFLLLRRGTKDTGRALFLAWLVLALSPVVLREYLNGGDVIANTAAVLTFMLGVLELPTRPRRIVAAVALGLAFAWRPNLWYWLPLLAAATVRRRGWQAASGYTSIAVGVCAAVTLPFYLTHVHDFAPLLTAQKVRRYDSVLPGSSLVALGTTGLLVIALVVGALHGRGTLTADCAVVQVFLLGFVVVLASVAAGKPDFSTLVLAYGLFFLVPAVLSVARAGPRTANGP